MDRSFQKNRKVKLPPLSHFKDKLSQIQDSRHDLGFQTEIKEIPITMKEVQLETDLLLNRPPTPPYIPIKPGRDVEIQAEEIFDFHAEVQPFLDIIVDQIINDAYVKYYYEKELQVIQENIQIHKDRQFELSVYLLKYELSEQEMREEREKLLKEFALKKQKTQVLQERNNLDKVIKNAVGTIMLDVEKALRKKQHSVSGELHISEQMITTNKLVSYPTTMKIAEQVVNQILLQAMTIQ
eukprot:NODE_363_length_10100_cov_0.133787.p3 type:complete len:239 gc:universal NODE_363_length_10100_cov_0.133787:1091-1807(+)